MPGGKTPLNASHVERRRLKKKYAIKKLEKKLENYNRQIKKFVKSSKMTIITLPCCRFSEQEVSLEDMKSRNTAYLQEDYLKRKFLATWEELCALLRIPSTIEVTHEDGAYSGTPYPEVNRRVQRLLRTDEFPDHMDIMELIERCNSKHSLGISAAEKSEMARKVFKEVGKLIKSRRVKDYKHHFGSHLTDAVTELDDPADRDEALLRQLQESLQRGEEKMNTLVEDFVVKQDVEVEETKEEGSGSPQGDSCNEEEEEEEEEGEEELVVVSEEELGSDKVSDGEEEEGEEGCLAKRIKLDTIEESKPPGVSSTASNCSSIDVEGVEEGEGSEGGWGEKPSSTGIISLSDSDSDVVIISDS